MSNSINMYYKFLEENQLYLFKEKKDIDSVLNEFSLSKICIETHVCIGRYINNVSLSFLIRKKGIIYSLSEITDRICDEFAVLFCGYHFSEGNECEDLDNYDYYVRGNLILFTLFGKNPTKELLEYAKEKISLYQVDDEDFHEWLNDYKNHSNINSKLIDDIFSYSFHDDT